MILYPTETIYALGVNVFDEQAMGELFTLKGREEGKAVSCLVRDAADIERFAVVDSVAAKIIAHFLPGPLTIVLRAQPIVPAHCLAPDGTLGFRISSDLIAEQVIADFMAEHDAPLSCTSANVSGLPTLSTPSEIPAQFGEKRVLITTVVDDGPRSGLASTIVRVVDGQMTILREGTITKDELESCILLG